VSAIATVYAPQANDSPARAPATTAACRGRAVAVRTVTWASRPGRGSAAAVHSLWVTFRFLEDPAPSRWAWRVRRGRAGTQHDRMRQQAPEEDQDGVTALCRRRSTAWKQAAPIAAAVQGADVLGDPQEPPGAPGPPDHRERPATGGPGGAGRRRALRRWLAWRRSTRGCR